MEKLSVVTDETFKAAIGASGLVLIEFGGDWCAPCVALEPVLAKLAGEWLGRASFYKMDTQTSPEAAADFGVRGLPTILFLKDGQELGRLVGMQSRQTLQSTLEKHSA